jgi:hypothetical protein
MKCIDYEYVVSYWEMGIGNWLLENSYWEIGYWRTLSMSKCYWKMVIGN